MVIAQIKLKRLVSAFSFSIPGVGEDISCWLNSEPLIFLDEIFQATPTAAVVCIRLSH
jgi:hypothetical protein